MDNELAGFAPSGLDGGAAPRTLTSAVFQQLRSDVIGCRLMPGHKLLMMPLAKRFGVSLAAVREALSRLAAEGLVVSIDQRGFMVSQTSIDDLIDVTETRIDIETIALRRSIKNGDSGWEKNIEIAWRMLEAMPYPQSSEPSAEYDRWSQLHDRFHLSLISACGSVWLLKFRSNLYERSERYRRLSRLSRSANRNILGEHRAIMDAVLARDIDGAARALADHYRLTAETLKAGAGSDHVDRASSQPVRDEAFRPPMARTDE